MTTDEQTTNLMISGLVFNWKSLHSSMAAAQTPSTKAN